MTLSELQQYDGQDGRKAYVAIGGWVYDVTASRHWTNGEHPGGHHAGADLTEDLARAPHIRGVIERFPVVAPLETKAPDAPPGRKVFPLLLVAGALLLAVIVWLVSR